MKIEQKISSSFLKLFITLFIVVAFFVGVISFISMSQQAHQLVLTASLTKAEYLRTYLSDQKEMITVLAGASVFRDLLNEPAASPAYAGIKKKVDERITRTIKLDSKINELFIIDKKGLIVASSNPVRILTNASQDLFFTEGKKGPYIRSVYYSTVTNNKAWGVAAPVIDDKTGVMMGIVVLRLETAPLFNLIQSQSKLGSTAEVFIVDKSYTLLNPTINLDVSQVLKKKIITQNTLDCFSKKEIALSGNTQEYSQFMNVKLFKDYRNMYVLGSHTFLPETQWCLVTKIDAYEIYEPVIRLLIITVGIFLLGFLVFYRMSMSVSRKITDPINKLYEDIVKIQEGDLNIQVDTSSPDEIGVLSRQFETMMVAVKESQKALDKKVRDQTSEIATQTKNLQDQKKAILNILEDVEQGKEKSDQLASDLQKFELAVKNVSEQIIITDPNGIILFANSAVKKMTGFSPEEILGKKAGIKKLWGGLMPLEFYQHLWKTLKVDKLPLAAELKNKRKNGEIYNVKASLSPILDKNGEVEYFVGIERDITKELAVDRMKTEFISLASHQLRTPLSAMRWFLEMLLDGDMGKLAPEQLDAVQNIASSNQRMIMLVNSLLNISRIESGRIIVDPSPTDINILLKGVVKELEKKCEEKKQKIIVSVHPQLPLISLDEKLIHEVYINLLTNAIKYSPAETDIMVTISKKDSDIISQISDNGYGIPPTQHDKIFQKFFRADNIVKRETDGTGLGLYLVKSIIESSQGKIWFISEENKGTTFWFTLPISGMQAKKGDVSLS